MTASGASARWMARRPRAIAGAALLALVAAGVAAPEVALGHRVPGGRSVVAQIEPCEVVLLVTWHPESGEESEALLTHAARGRTAPGRAAGGSGTGDWLRALYGARALAPLSIRADGQLLSARQVEVKLVQEPPGSGRLAAAALVSYAFPAGTRRLEIANGDAHRTRISWVDRSGGRFVGPLGGPAARALASPVGGSGGGPKKLAPERWHGGVASILLLSPRGTAWPSCDPASP